MPSRESIAKQVEFDRVFPTTNSIIAHLLACGEITYNWTCLHQPTLPSFTEYTQLQNSFSAAFLVCGETNLMQHLNYNVFGSIFCKKNLFNVPTVLNVHWTMKTNFFRTKTLGMYRIEVPQKYDRYQKILKFLIRGVQNIPYSKRWKNCYFVPSTLN